MARRQSTDTSVAECLQALERPVLKRGGLSFQPLLFNQQRQLEQALQDLFGEEAFLFTMPLSFTVRLQQVQQGQAVMEEGLLKARAHALLRTRASEVLELLAKHTGYNADQLEQLTVAEVYEVIQHLLEVTPL